MKLLLILLGIMGFSNRDTTFTILYNNVPHDTSLVTAWGMSCYIRGFENNILFDAGGDGEILLHNMKKLNINPKSVQLVVLSHIHADHVNGIWELLKINPEVRVYLPASLPGNLKSKIKSEGAEVIEVSKPARICENVWTTGEMGEYIREQALVLTTQKGIVVVTGCAHPGIVNIVEKAQSLIQNRVYLVLGGFHLLAYPEREVKKIIKKLKKIGVEKIGPSHCTGGRPIELFREAWGEDFFDLGCGAVFRMGK